MSVDCGLITPKSESFGLPDFDTGGQQPFPFRLASQKDAHNNGLSSAKHEASQATGKHIIQSGGCQSNPSKKGASSLENVRRISPARGSRIRKTKDNTPVRTSAIVPTEPSIGAVAGFTTGAPSPKRLVESLSQLGGLTVSSQEHAEVIISDSSSSDNSDDEAVMSGSSNTSLSPSYSWINEREDRGHSSQREFPSAQSRAAAEHWDDVRSNAIASYKHSSSIPMSDPPVAASLATNPRRSQELRAIPTLVRQNARSDSFVTNLIGFAAKLIGVIWPQSSCNAPSNKSGHSSAPVIPLTTYVQELLKRSKTSHSTLMLALYYLVVLKPNLPDLDFTREQPRGRDCRTLQCGRRMFLAALMLASKYLLERNYSTATWSIISGLPREEIDANELQFFKLIDYSLFTRPHIYQRWQFVVYALVDRQTHPPAPDMHTSWHAGEYQANPELLIQRLSPGLMKNISTLWDFLDDVDSKRYPSAALPDDDEVSKHPLSPEGSSMTFSDDILVSSQGASSKPAQPSQRSEMPLRPRPTTLPTPQITPFHRSALYLGSNGGTAQPSRSQSPSAVSHAGSSVKSPANSMLPPRPPQPRTAPQLAAGYLKRDFDQNPSGIPSSTTSTALSPESLGSDATFLTTRTRSSSISSMSSLASSVFTGLQSMDLSGRPLSLGPQAVHKVSSNNGPMRSYYEVPTNTGLYCPAAAARRGVYETSREQKPFGQGSKSQTPVDEATLYHLQCEKGVESEEDTSRNSPDFSPSATPKHHHHHHRHLHHFHHHRHHRHHPSKDHHHHHHRRDSLQEAVSSILHESPPGDNAGQVLEDQFLNSYAEIEDNMAAVKQASSCSKGRTPAKKAKVAPGPSRDKKRHAAVQANKARDEKRRKQNGWQDPAWLQTPSLSTVA